MQLYTQKSLTLLVSLFNIYVWAFLLMILSNPIISNNRSPNNSRVIVCKLLLKLAIEPNRLVVVSHENNLYPSTMLTKTITTLNPTSSWFFYWLFYYDLPPIILFFYFSAFAYIITVYFEMGELIYFTYESS